jgi:hypothetical protein
MIEPFINLISKIQAETEDKIIEEIITKGYIQTYYYLAMEPYHNKERMLGGLVDLNDDSKVLEQIT